MKIILFFLITIYANASLAVPIGFNQAWFHDNYGSQFMNSSFDAEEVDRVFALAKQANTHSMRIWFFESSRLSMIKFDGLGAKGVEQEFINNVISTLRIAKKYKIKVYFTIFDAHAYKPFKDKRLTFKRFRSLFSKEYGQLFLDNVFTPLLMGINKAGLASTIDKFDLTNEMDAVINRFGFKKGWRGARRMICQWKKSIQANQGFQNTPVSFSVRLHPFLFLPFNFLSDKGPMQCADYIDLHTYSNRGAIHRCKWVKRYSLKNKKPIILGEFGQGFFTHRYDNQLQEKVTRNFIKNAQRCGFNEAFAWRLSDIRPGFNREARYSYEAHGKPRPAFYIIKNHNK